MFVQMILWDVGKGDALNVIECHPDVIYSMSFNKDGSRIATTCKDKKLRVIDPRTGFIISVSFVMLILLMKINSAKHFSLAQPLEPSKNEPNCLLHSCELK